MKKNIFALLMFNFIFIGCGGSENISSLANVNFDGNDIFNVAKNNTLTDVNSTFNGYHVVVYSNKKLENTPSNSTKAIYGKINGQNTASLLKLNDQYGNGDIFVVKVFLEDRLVGESERLLLTGDILNFDEIIIP